MGESEPHAARTRGVLMGLVHVRFGFVWRRSEGKTYGEGGVGVVGRVAAREGRRDGNRWDVGVAAAAGGEVMDLDARKVAVV